VNDFLRQTATIVAKDLRIEWRSREIIYTMVLFSALLVVIFSFAFTGEGAPASDVAGGILWVAVAFSGTLGLTRIFEREREAETITALLVSPAARGALYLGKLLGTLVYIVLTEVVVVPLIFVLFSVQLSAARCSSASSPTPS
jgi:heme exporter protein CcmB